MNWMLRQTRNSRFLPLLLVLGSAAHAGTVTYYIDIFSGLGAQTTLPSGSGVPTLSTADSGPVAIQIPQFNMNDPNPNHVFTLTGVTFTLLESSVATVTVKNFDNTGTHSSSSASNCFNTLGGDTYTPGSPTGTCSGIPKSDTFNKLNASMPLSVSQNSFPFISVTSTDTTSPDKSGAATAGHYLVVTENTAADCTQAGGFNYNSSTKACTLDAFVAGTTNFTGLAATGSATTSLSTFLSFFESLTPVSLNYTADVGDITVHGTETSGNGELNFGGSGKAGGIFEVQYTYQEVYLPEPTSMVLIGTSVLALGAMLRRKNRKS